MCKFTFLSVSALLLAGGCSGNDKAGSVDEKPSQAPFVQTAALPAASGGFALAVGAGTITGDEVIQSVIEHNGAFVPLTERFAPIAQVTDLERFKEVARAELEQILVTRVSNILLYLEAKKNIGENAEQALEQEVERRVRDYFAGFNGDYAKAEETLKQMGMDRKSFREHQRKSILSQYFVSSKLPKTSPVSYSELLARYNEMKEESLAVEGTIRIRLIDIQAARLQVADPNSNRLQQARKLAANLLGRIWAGEDFGVLAKQYSHGHRRDFGGLWKARQPQALAEPYDILAKRAEKMKPGEIAGPIEKEGHIFIMKLEEERPRSYRPLSEVQSEIEAMITFDRQKEAINRLEAKLVPKAVLAQSSEFIDFCLERIYRMSNR